MARTHLIAQLQAFEAGDRKNEMVSVAVQNLSPIGRENLAAYHSRIEISAGKAPSQ